MSGDPLNVATSVQSHLNDINPPSDAVTAVSSSVHISQALSSSSVSAHENICAVPSVDFAVGVVYDNIVKSRGVGLRSSCFSSDRNVLIRLLELHGLTNMGDAEIPQLQHTILRHLLLGNCFRVAEHNVLLSRGLRCDSVCGQLLFAFPSATDMSIAFVCHLVDDITVDQKLSYTKISTLASALVNESCPSSRFSSPNNVKRDALRLFNRILNSSSPHDVTSIIPVDLEKMSKSELQTFACRHSISYNWQTFVSDLRDLILGHGLSASCLQSVDTTDWDNSPPECAQSLKTFLSTGQSAESTCFIVHSLSVCAQSMSLKPLCRVLSHLDIPFERTESLNQLRHWLRLYVSHLQKSRSADGTDISWKKLFSDLVHTRESWPQLIPPASKEEICEWFLNLTGSSALKTGVCASCSQACCSRFLQHVK